jgi:hypothetical protein
MFTERTLQSNEIIAVIDVTNSAELHSSYH